MNVSELQDHLRRIDRSLRRTRKRTGDGHSHTVEVDGRTVTYKLNGVPDLEELEDHVRDAFVNLWSVRDYVVHTMAAQDRDVKDWLWARVKSRSCLSLAADLANVAKHGKLKPKSSHWICQPSFGKGRYTARGSRDPKTGAAIGSGIRQITFRENEVEMDFMNQDDPKWFSYELPILDSDGEEVREACQILVDAHDEWSKILSELGIPWPGQAP